MKLHITSLFQKSRMAQQPSFREQFDNKIRNWAALLTRKSEAASPRKLKIWVITVTVVVAIINLYGIVTAVRTPLRTIDIGKMPPRAATVPPGQPKAEAIRLREISRSRYFLDSVRRDSSAKNHVQKLLQDRAGLIDSASLIEGLNSLRP
jgi:hypothetical protein